MKERPRAVSNREQLLTDLDHILRGTCHKKPLMAARDIILLKPNCFDYQF